MFKFFEFLVESIGWLQIVAFPFIIGLGIGAIIYFPDPNTTRLLIGISAIILGLIVGILLATKFWKKTGTIKFLSSIIATPEVDKKDSDESNSITNKK